MPGRAFVKSKEKKLFKKEFTSMLQLTEKSEYVDAGEVEVTVSYLDIPINDGIYNAYKSATYTFGCLPWHLELTRHTRSTNGKVKHHVKVALMCTYNDTEWLAKASGTVTMKKWREKLPKGAEISKIQEPREKFSAKFNHFGNSHRFIKEFTLVGQGITLQGQEANSQDLAACIKTRQIRFRLDFILHNVRKSFSPVYDFQKPSDTTNAVIKVGTDSKHQFHVNKELLSMYSEGFERMFNSEGFREQLTKEVELKGTTPDVFRDFLYIIYPSQKRPQMQNVRGLLELARMYFIPTVTEHCEHRLLTAHESDISVADRLKLADEYGLLQLKAQVMQKNDPNMLRDIQGLRPDTLSMLVRKLQHLDKRRKEREQKQRKKEEESGKKEEPMDVDGQQRQGTSSGRSTHHRHHRSHRRN